MESITAPPESTSKLETKILPMLSGLDIQEMLVILAGVRLIARMTDADRRKYNISHHELTAKELIREK